MAETANVPVKREKGGAVEPRHEWAALDHLRQEVDRLFDVRHRSRLDQIETAPKALGKRVEVHVA